MPVQQRHLRSLAATCFRDRQQVTLTDWWQRRYHGIVSGKMGAKCFYGRKMLFRALESLFGQQCVFDLTLLILLKTTSKWWSMAL